MKFVDEVSIQVASGKGGPGAVSFRREAMVARGGPDGGDGGRGGDVIFRVDPQMGSLLDLKFQKSYRAGNGEPGAGQRCSGADGADLVIAIPKGTVIKNTEGHLIADMGEQEEFIFLKGGRGGKGNWFFKSSINQAPTRAQPGEPGQEANIHLELKLLADVGLIGLPNAGKSTLISHISAAKPKIADYPFTTLIPNLGVVRYGEFKTFVVADIPGLIEGAHMGVGLGTQFLRHIERTRLFVHLIDVSEMALKDPWDAYCEINNELKEHDKAKQDEEGYVPLCDRPQLVVLNKIDAVPEERLKEIYNQFADRGITPFAVSAATGRNLKELVFEIGRRVFADESQQ